MILALDSITHKKLIIVRQLYQQATSHLTRSNEMSKIMAVISFDLAIETILKLAMRLADNTKSPKSDINELMQQLDAALILHGITTIQAKPHILRVRQIRNAAQHEARTPTNTELNECHIYTRDFLSDFTLQAWSIDIQNIRLSSMIRDNVIRTIMEKAESAFQTGNYTESTYKANGGLAWTLHVVNRMLIPSLHGAFFRLDYEDPYPSGTPAMPKDVNRDLWRNIVDLRKELSDKIGKTQKMLDEIKDNVKGQQSQIEAIQEILLINLFGIDYVEYLRMKSIAGHVTLVLDNPENPYIENMKQHIGVSDAEFVLNYCIDAVAKIEAQVGDINAPFQS